MIKKQNWIHVINDHKFLILVLFLTLIVSVLFIELYENERIWGDEKGYIELSHYVAENQISPVISLLPGYLRYTWWPPLPYSIYSFFARDSLLDHFSERELLDDEDFQVERMKFLKDVTYLNLLLLLASGVLIYLISIRLNLSETYSALAVALTILNPRVLFYVQTFWPELIHFALLSAAILFFISYLNKNTWILLLLSSVLFVYCVFTKLIVAYYFYLLILILFYYHRKTLKQKSTIYALCLFIIPFFLLTTIQKAVINYKFDAFAISLNSWINIEKGFIPHAIAVEEGFNSIGQRYDKASEDPVEREIKSKERVIEYISNKISFEELITHQVIQFFRQLSNSYFNKGITQERWSRADTLPLVEGLLKFFSWFLFIFGSVGAMLYARKNIITFTVALFVIYYLATLFVVFYNARYFVPLIPFLAIFTSLVLRDLVFSSRRETVDQMG